jgi:hypothetical protein
MPVVRPDQCRGLPPVPYGLDRRAVRVHGLLPESRPRLSAGTTAIHQSELSAVPIRFACPNPNCRADFTANDRLAGSQLTCSMCGQLMLVPTPPPVAMPLPSGESTPIQEQPAQPVVRYYSADQVAEPPQDLFDYRPRHRHRVAEEYDYREEGRYHVSHQEKGTFASAFGRTFGEGMGCLAVVAVIGVLLLLFCVLPAVLATLGNAR